MRKPWILVPTNRRLRSHAITRLGSFWLGRVGTPSSTHAEKANVCPTNSALLVGVVAIRPFPTLVAV